MYLLRRRKKLILLKELHFFCKEKLINVESFFTSCMTEKSLGTEFRAFFCFPFLTIENFHVPMYVLLIKLLDSERTEKNNCYLHLNSVPNFETF